MGERCFVGFMDRDGTEHIIDTFLAEGYTAETERQVKEYRARQFKERYGL